MSVRGVKAAQQSAAGFARTTFFSLKDGDSATLRFLTDADPTEVAPGVLAGGWITVLQHQNVQTKSAPTGFQGNWPGHMTAVCRAQNLTELGIDSPFADCALCMSGSKQTQRTWALAVLREEVRDAGRTTGFRDITREVVVKEGEKPVTEPAIVVINLGRRNFFGPISGWYGRNGTVLDRDFAVTRTGDGLDTLYGPIGLDPIGTADGRVFDLRDPEFMSRYLPDVEGPTGYATASDKMLVPVLSDRMSDAYYGKFFDTRVQWTEPDKEDKNSSVRGAPAAAATAAAPTGDAPAGVDMNALRSRIVDYSGDSTAAPEAAAVEASDSTAAAEATPATPAAPTRALAL
jgi:hypothetical protein